MYIWYDFSSIVCLVEAFLRADDVDWFNVGRKLPGGNLSRIVRNNELFDRYIGVFF